MIRLYFFIAVSVGIYIFLHSNLFKQIKNVFQKNFPFSEKKLTMFDVRDCILNGEKDLAVDIYCQIFSVSQEEAHQAVDQLERSIHENN